MFGAELSLNMSHSDLRYMYINALIRLVSLVKLGLKMFDIQPSNWNIACKVILDAPALRKVLPSLFMVKKIKKISTEINTHWLELPLSRTYFHCPKGVRATEVRLYIDLLALQIQAKNLCRCSEYLVVCSAHLRRRDNSWNCQSL